MSKDSRAILRHLPKGAPSNATTIHMLPPFASTHVLVPKRFGELITTRSLAHSLGPHKRLLNGRDKLPNQASCVSPPISAEQRATTLSPYHDW